LRSCRTGILPAELRMMPPRKMPGIGVSREPLMWMKEI
jgi:hypothetical protein